MDKQTAMDQGTNTEIELKPNQIWKTNEGRRVILVNLFDNGDRELKIGMLWIYEIDSDLSASPVFNRLNTFLGYAKPTPLNFTNYLVDIKI